MNKTAKEKVIETLIGKEDLSIKDIESKIKESHGKEHGYHSIYKAVQQLTDEKKLAKNNSKYSISKEWIHKKVKYSNKLKKHLTASEEEANVITFTSIKQLHRFLKNFEKEKVDLFNKDKKGNVIFITNHCYNYLLQPAKELKHIRDIISNNNELMVLCHGDSTLDKWTKKAYDKRDVKMVTDSGTGGIAALNIYDNYAIQIFYGKKFMRALESTFLKTQDVSDLDIAELFDNMENLNYQINVAIFKEKSIIESLKERAKLTFNRKVKENKSKKEK